MEYIKNNSRYIEPSVLRQCFRKGEHLIVDKVITGNGFSTAFLTEPVPVGKFNIMIAPNKSVVKDKREAIETGRLKTPNRVKFFYKESDDFDFESSNLLVFVADSFLLMRNRLEYIKHRINWVLLDEAHSTEIQSLFRRPLVLFRNRVDEMVLGDSVAVASVTATPNHFTKVDIQIVNSYIHPITIHQTSCRVSSYTRMRKDLDAGRNVLVCTNSKEVLYQLKDADGVLRANFLCGTTLMRSLVQMMKIEQDAESNLTVASVRAFEGVDLYGDDYAVYYFEDRAKDYESFYISNLYQAINRVRNGAAYIEYIRRNLKDVRQSMPSRQTIDRFIQTKKITNTKKQTKKYKPYQEFVVFNVDSVGVWTVEPNTIAIELAEEKRLWDLGFRHFQQFLDDRNITIVKLDEQQSRVPKSRIKREKLIENLKSNEELIRKEDLFGDDFRLELLYTDARTKLTSKDYLKHLQKFLDCKNYDGTRLKTLREREAEELFSDAEKLSKLVKTVTDAYCTRSIEKYGYKVSKPYRDAFIEQGAELVRHLILLFANERVHIPSNWVANRDYNYLTKLGVGEIEIIAKHFSFSVKEIDIKSAFPRILYAMVGKELPDDFYGKNKENKRAINVALNQIFFDEHKALAYDPMGKSSKKAQRQNARRKLEQYNIDSEVINFVIERFFDNDDRGALFHYCSFYERKLISKLKDIVKDGKNSGIARRHDSLIIFNNEDNLVWLNQLDFLDVRGWFKVDIDELEEVEEVEVDDNHNDEDIFGLF